MNQILGGGEGSKGGRLPYERNPRRKAPLLRFAVTAAAFDEIWFDCDSTLCSIEGVDVLGADRPEVAELTRRAMAGEIAMADVYGARLDLLRPSRVAVEALAAEYARTLVPDAAEVVAALRSLGKRVAIISGGLLPGVLGAARALSITAEDVFAVEIRFGADGRYAGFDSQAPLARNGGKAEVLRLRRRPGSRAALVGDGATDLEAAPAVDLFVGFGGVALREPVRVASPAYLRGPSMAPLLLLVLTDSERERLRASPRFASVLAAAESGRDSIERRLS